MPPPQSSPAPVGVGASADVNRICRSWAQQTNLELATEQELPLMISNSQPACTNDPRSSHIPSCSLNIQSQQHILTILTILTRTRSPIIVPTSYSPNTLNYSLPSVITSRSSSPQSLLTKIPSTSTASTTKSNKLI